MPQRERQPRISSSPKPSAAARERGRNGAEPIIGHDGREIQPYGSVVQLPIALEESARREVAQQLNQILADTITLRDLYKKHHWQVVGPTFYPLHLLFDKHYEEQAELVDLLAERVQLLGGVAIAMAADVAETTRIPRPPRGREDVPGQLSRLVEAHEIVLREVREAAKRAEELGDDGSNDLLVSDVLRRNEFQVWFVSEHLVGTRLTSNGG